ncbi:unnamed protein product [Vitrella brassicaformis CCMP3155]|uniref:Uncharacterized protein n=1 Tax=Vitrella brassicaformis (strain CCMP3155) TaxID=1169540 RepID=A0A0G4GQ01_VITBC|nr:unnamed protein product [Vitrella brassicaformis CCMP3155]|mmetsp:Transcript_36249/g.90495  ORF Transcript_36249/g.90495 Transcript_36249/m.90495 type:complete len:160 (-) Transcript_36249:719-1198(-)|eukprot:CEM32454.1 unnamed protein product [Vitrella brassicaformis CCMP3155]
MSSVSLESDFVLMFKRFFGSTPTNSASTSPRPSPKTADQARQEEEDAPNLTMSPKGRTSLKEETVEKPPLSPGMQPSIRSSTAASTRPPKDEKAHDRKRFYRNCAFLKVSSENPIVAAMSRTCTPCVDFTQRVAGRSSGSQQTPPPAAAAAAAAAAGGK